MHESETFLPLQRHGVEMGQAAIQQADLVQLLVRKCSKGTGFSKMWLLRDLEILSIMLYSSKKEISSMAEVTDSEPYDRKPEKEHDSDHSSCCADDPDPNKPDPLEGLDEETKICFQVQHAIELASLGLDPSGSPLTSWGDAV